MRTAEYARLGGMDEDYFLYGEDAEFSLRAGRSGLRRVIVPDAVIVHEVGGSSDAGGAKGCMVMAGKVTLLRKTWSPMRAAIGVRLLVAGVGVRAGLETVTRRSRAPWRTVSRGHEPSDSGSKTGECRNAVEAIVANIASDQRLGAPQQELGSTAPSGRRVRPP